MIVTTKKGRYKIGRNTSLISPEEVGIKIEEYFAPSAGHEEKIKKNLSKEISEEEIKKSLASVDNFIFETNQSCFLDCSYCVYGGHYQYYRHHRDKIMNLKTAQKAIDFFYEIRQSPYQIERRPRMLLSFYGGESLMVFDNLMKMVTYAKKHRDAKRLHLVFSLSTNGVLLTPEVVKTLVENKFILFISLDGPESEHDRFRVFKSGKGTFKKIMENVKFIKKKYPDYFETNVRFIATLHPFHDLVKIEEFFLSHDELFNEENVRINDLKDDSLTNTEWLDAQKDMYKRKKTQLQKGRWFYKKIFIEPLETAIAEKETSFLFNMTNFTRSCFPGSERLFVDPEGNFHICEKINRYFTIGNLDQGFDFQKIKWLFEQWRKKTLELECWKCRCLYLCPFCYASAGKDGVFVIKKEDCRKLENNLSERISDYLTFKEEEDEKSLSNHDLDVPGFLDSL